MSRARTVALLAAVALLGGCGTVDRGASDLTPSIEPPRPVGVQDPAERPSAAQAPPADCNALASLRPPSPMPGPGRFAPGSDLQRIADRGKLLVGTDQNIYLFAFRDPLTGRIVGFDVDIARKIAEAIFGDADEDRVQFVTLASDERIGAVTEGTVDLVAQTMTITCERRQKVAFSTVYYEAVQRILVSKDSEIAELGDLADRRVCASAGSTSINTVAQMAPTARVIAVKYWTDCLVMLHQGQVDAITTDDTILAGLAAQDPTVHLVGEGFNAEPYGLAMSRSSPELVRFVNGVLERMRQDGSWAEIYQRWLDRPAPRPPAPLYEG
jgi:polar amino acid transport system substrate-binding protein